MSAENANATMRTAIAGGAACKAALDHAVTAHYDEMRGAVRRRGLEPALATEVVHDLYLLLSRKPEHLAGRVALKAFLIRAAVNLGIDRLRRRSFEQRLFTALDAGAEEIAGSFIPMERRIAAAQRIAALQEVISGLPRQCRNVFIAYHLTGLSKDEVGAGLGMKRRMVDRHLKKALLHCMAQLPDDDETSDPGSTV